MPLDPEVLPAAAGKVAGILQQRRDIRDLDNGLPLPGHRLEDRGRQGGGRKVWCRHRPRSVPRVQLVTNGLKVTEYRPIDSDKSVDILLRFPADRRSLDQIDELRVQTQVGHVPIGNFVKRVPAQRVGNINRVNGNRVMTVSANIAEGVQAAQGAEGHRG